MATRPAEQLSYTFPTEDKDHGRTWRRRTPSAAFWTLSKGEDSLRSLCFDESADERI